MDPQSELAVNQGAGMAPPPPASAQVELPSRISSSSDSSDLSETHKSGSQSARRAVYPRNRTARPRGLHKRMYSYPGGSPGRAPMGPMGYPSQGYYQQYGSGMGMRMPGHYGDGSEYGPNPYYPGMAPMPMCYPWMGGYDWGAYNMYVMGNVISRRSERPTRIVFLWNLSTSVDENKVQELASKYGVVRGIDCSQREYTSGVFISFWDVRNAEAAVKGFPKDLAAYLGEENNHHVQACFMLPPVGVPGMENQGIIAINGASEDVTDEDLEPLFLKYGDVKNVWKTSPPGAEFRFVELYDARCAEAAMRELKSPQVKDSVLKLEYAPFAGLEPAQHPMPAYPPHFMGAGQKQGDDSTHESSGTHGVWGMQTPYAWGPYHSMPHHHHHHSYGGEGSLNPTGSGNLSDVGQLMGDFTPRGDGAWGPQGYMGYGGMQGSFWPYGQQGMHMVPPPMYNDVMGGVRADGGPNSPGHGSNASDSHNWRPHRTARSSGDRNYDPSQFEFNLDEASSEAPNARTTLMIRNIPNKYSQKMLLDVLNRKYGGKYDFFYLPIDFKNRCNLGYAFVNFKDAVTTAEFYKEFHSKNWEEFNSKKVCEITYARVQGRDALIEHFRNSRFPCNDPDYLPLVFDTVEDGAVQGGKKVGAPGAKGTPVHHWTSTQYPNSQTAVAAH